MKSEGIFTPPKRTDKTNKAGEEPSKRTRAIRQFFPKILASTALVAVTLTCLVGTGCVDRSDQTSRLGRKVDAVQAGPIQTYEYSPKPTVDDDGSAGDNLIPFGTSAISIIPENICVEVSENSTVICGKGIGSGNEYWRFGVEDAEIPLPDGSRVPILDGAPSLIIWHSGALQSRSLIGFVRYLLAQSLQTSPMFFL